MYIYCLFLFAQKNPTKTQSSFEIGSQTKLGKCFSTFFGFAKFLWLEETIDWSKLLKFGSTCSNWQGTIGMNTKIGESTIFKAKTKQCCLRENSNMPNLQNIILQQTLHTGHRLVQSHQQKSQRDTIGHDLRMLDDEPKQIFI